jgi:hypothetical protein
LVVLATKTDEQSAAARRKRDSWQVETRMFPVSVKGVAVQGGKVLLLRNERTSGSCPAGVLAGGAVVVG